MKFINGLFYTQKMTGVQRFACELIKELDAIVQPNEYSVIVPEYALNIPSLKNIKIIKYGNSKGFLWEQWDLFLFMKKNKGVLLNLCNSQPILYPSIICIHDVAYKTHPEFFKTFHGRLSVLWHRLIFKEAILSKHHIFTVSHFSKYSIIDSYNIQDKSRITVLGNGWQHITSIKSDDSILQKYNLEKGHFYFTLGNINYNKNIKWVLEYASRHPEQLFIVSGKKVMNSNINVSNIPNVKWLGYLPDEQIVALYKNCRAFIFPSIHEGFGIPPLEALSLGARIIVSNSTCLPEIFQSSAIYIDPYDTNVDLEKLLESYNVTCQEYILKQYSWSKFAQKLVSTIKQFY